MFNNLRPLLPYLRKYRATYVIGALCVLCNNGVWILFPLVIQRTIDDLNLGVNRHKLLTCCCCCWRLPAPRPSSSSSPAGS